MNNIILYLCFAASLILNWAVISSMDKLDEEYITIKQLYNLQQLILEDNFSQQEIDSMYLEYNYYYLNSYYEKNYK